MAPDTESLTSGEFNGDDERPVFDLHDIALLLNYERASTEPRFRHTKLTEVTNNDFKTIRASDPEWINCKTPRTGFVLHRMEPPKEKMNDPDLRSNILPDVIPKEFTALNNLTSKQLETYYWQIRNHDGCFATVTLFQHFADLLPRPASFRIRTVDGGKVMYYTTYAYYNILEMDLVEPQSLNLSVVISGGNGKPMRGVSYLTGCDRRSVHAVLGFRRPESTVDTQDTILDLSSLQFGDVGRGFKGKGLFVLEPANAYAKRLASFAVNNTFDKPKVTHGINAHTTPNNDWLQEVARRAYDRWNNREQVPWCDYCGAPPKKPAGLQRCSQCRNVNYCDAEHQKAAWSFHKHFCEKEAPEEVA